MKKHHKSIIALVTMVTIAVFWVIVASFPVVSRAGSQGKPAETIEPNMQTLEGTSTTWSQTLSAKRRFKLVLENDEAVLDKETGLVWEQSPDTTTRDWDDACSYCYQKEVGGCKGWRLPTVEELASLVDTSVTGSPKLPSGYEDFFSNVQSDGYWSSTTYAGNPVNAWGVGLNDGHVGNGPKNIDGYVWCVRGGHGHDGY